MARMTSNQHLDAFLADWLAWAEAGAPEYGSRYSRASGLCAALKLYLIAQRTERGQPLSERTCESVRKRLVERFKRGGLDEHTPFNLDFSHYLADSNNLRHHTNSERLAWVREQVSPQLF